MPFMILKNISIMFQILFFFFSCIEILLFKLMAKLEGLILLDGRTNLEFAWKMGMGCCLLLGLKANLRLLLSKVLLRC